MSAETLKNHLASGSTTVCRAWRIVRRDGLALGFTDHDLDLEFEGLRYSARTGLTARNLQQATGLSVDNSEALGALSDDAIREEDIAAGRFDDAEVKVFLVNWQNVDDQMILFRGTFGEIQREKGAFRVELRGLTERLNVPFGRLFQRGCPATLGDRACKVDLSAQGRTITGTVAGIGETGEISVLLDDSPSPGWFAQGVISVLNGDATGITREIRGDAGDTEVRTLDLWHPFFPTPQTGDLVVLTTGCDGRLETCRGKFDNVENFRGFPHIPGDDWLRRGPTAADIR